MSEATQAKVESNILSAPYGVWVDDTPKTSANNTVSKNTLIGGACGLKLTSSEGDITSGNTYHNVSQTVCPN